MVGLKRTLAPGKTKWLCIIKSKSTRILRGAIKKETKRQGRRAKGPPGYRSLDLPCDGDQNAF